MIKLFRTIRQNLIMENKTSKPAYQFGRYLKYAIGEITLVMIGILLALQVNNWNETRKELLLKNKLYHNLEASLRTDSIALAGIIEKIDKSLACQKLIISTPSDEILSQFDKLEMQKQVRQIWEGVYSFFPKTGVCNQLLASNLVSTQ